jgi:hypothetical protein
MMCVCQCMFDEGETFYELFIESPFCVVPFVDTNSKANDALLVLDLLCLIGFLLTSLCECCLLFSTPSDLCFFFCSVCFCLHFHAVSLLSLLF